MCVLVCVICVTTEWLQWGSALLQGRYNQHQCGFHLYSNGWTCLTLGFYVARLCQVEVSGWVRYFDRSQEHITHGPCHIILSMCKQVTCIQCIIPIDWHNPWLTILVVTFLSFIYTGSLVHSSLATDLRRNAASFTISTVHLIAFPFSCYLQLPDRPEFPKSNSKGSRYAGKDLSHGTTMKKRSEVRCQD